MRIYNSLTDKLEEFKPIREGKVSMYVCGPTVYNYVHIGNMRPAITFDMVRNYLEYLGYEVTYASNFTDINPKIIKKSGCVFWLTITISEESYHVIAHLIDSNSLCRKKLYS